MSRILFLIIFLVSTVLKTHACDDSVIDSISFVDNGNNTSTITINLSIDVGGPDGYSYGFGLIFSNTSSTPPIVLNSPAFTPTLSRSGYNDLFGKTGNNIGTTLSPSNSSNYFDDRYGNRTDVLTYETDDDWFGFGSTDYSVTVEVTVEGCIDKIELDADFRSLGPGLQASVCLTSLDTTFGCVLPQNPCDCSSPDCSVDLTADPLSPTFNSCESWTGDETNSTVTSYHTITSSADGTLGILQQLQPTTCALTDADMQSALTNRTATLYNFSDCDGATITPSTANAGNSLTLNPEWTGLSPNTQYIIKLEVDLLSCDISGSCLDYYYPSIAVSPCGTCLSPNCNIAGPYVDFADADANYMAGLQTITPAVTNQQVTTYHLVNSGPTGSIGFDISNGSSLIIPPGSPCITNSERSAVLYPLGSGCSGTPISPTLGANNNPYYNPEFIGLSTNTQYILVVTTSAITNCEVDKLYVTYYEISTSNCNANIGSFSMDIDGLSTSSYNIQLYPNETFNISSNGDETLPPPSGPDPAGIGYAAFSCDPSSYNLNDVNTYNTVNSCFLGWYYDNNFSDQNNTNGWANVLNSNPYWIVPVTLDDVCHPSKPSSPCYNTSGDNNIGLDLNGDNCFDVGNPIQIEYLTQPASCGSCSNANCPITPVSTYDQRFSGYYPFGNCNSMGNISNTTYITYHTVTAGAVGEVGLVQQLSISPQGCETRSAVLRPITNSCNSSYDIYPSVNNANNVGSGFNPEWYGLVPGDQYIVILTTTLGVGCEMDRACLVSYEIPTAPPPPVYNCGTVEFNITDQNDIPLNGPFDCSNDTIFLAAVNPPNEFIADQWVYPGFIVTVTPNTGTWDGVNSLEILINGIVVANLDPASFSLLPTDPFIKPITYAQNEDFSFGVVGNNGATFDYIITQASDGTVVSNGTWTIGGNSQTNAGYPTATGTFSGPGVTDDPNNGGKGFFVPSNAGTGTHTITYTYDNGDNCTGSYTIDVTVNGTSSILDTTICFGNSVTINGTIYNASNPSGQELYTSSSGCDSTVIVNLTELPDISSSIDTTVCYGTSVTINGTIYNTSNPTGQEIYAFPSGCDSIVNITLTELPAISSVLNTTVCFGDSIIINGTIYNAANAIGQEVYSTSSGCDSTVNVNLTELPAITSSINPTICPNETFVYDNITYDTSNSSGIHIFTSASGCDSTVTLTLNIININATNLDATVCFGDSIMVNGNTYNSTNPTGQETFTSIDGCDSVVNINLIELDPITETINPSICSDDSFDYNGTTYNIDNPSGSEILTSVFGCDSTVIINLNINNDVFYSLDTTVCSGESIDINGTIYDAINSTGQEIFKLPSGCDSIVSVTLFENTTDTSYIDTVLYVGQNLNIANQVLVESDFEGFVFLQDAYGCDSVINAKVRMLYESVHFVPTGFSPNSDGNNDFIGVMGGGISEIKFYIYNRWGERVFSYEGNYDGTCPLDPLCNWDGTYKSQPVNVETYVYYLKGTYMNGKDFIEKGTISLIK